MKTRKVLFFFYNRLNDPLLQSNIFQYINQLSKEGDQYLFSIITFEDKKFPLTEEETDKFRKEFLKNNIFWHPLKWHPGSNLFYKTIDLISGFIKIVKLRLNGYKHVVTLGSIAGSFVYLMSKITPIKYYLYQYEPHSEYAIDNHIWRKSSLQFKLLNKLERYSVKHCSVVSSGTNNMAQRLKEWKVKKPFFKIASVANDKIFNFNEESRNKIRDALQIHEAKKLIIYPGKIGDLYANGVTLINIFKSIKKIYKNCCFLVITPSGSALKEIMDREEQDLVNSIKIIPPIPHEQMPGYLSAADLGIIAVLPGQSKKFISNIKVGEYLCAGLPYLICKGVSEDDLIAEKNSVGIVVNDFTFESISAIKEKMDKLFSIQKSDMVYRCRKVGIDYRGFEIQYGQFVEALNNFTQN